MLALARENYLSKVCYTLLLPHLSWSRSSETNSQLCSQFMIRSTASHDLSRWIYQPIYQPLRWVDPVWRVSYLHPAVHTSIQKAGSRQMGVTCRCRHAIRPSNLGHQPYNCSIGVHRTTLSYVRIDSGWKLRSYSLVQPCQSELAKLIFFFTAFTDARRLDIYCRIFRATHRGCNGKVVSSISRATDFSKD